MKKKKFKHLLRIIKWWLILDEIIIIIVKKKSFFLSLFLQMFALSIRLLYGKNDILKWNDRWKSDEKGRMMLEKVISFLSLQFTIIIETWSMMMMMMMILNSFLMDCLIDSPIRLSLSMYTYCHCNHVDILITFQVKFKIWWLFYDCLLLSSHNYTSFIIIIIIMNNHLNLLNVHPFLFYFQYFFQFQFHFISVIHINLYNNNNNFRHILKPKWNYHFINPRINNIYFVFVFEQKIIINCSKGFTNVLYGKNVSIIS